MNGPRIFGGTNQPARATYTDILDDSFLDASDKKDLMAEAIIGNSAALVARRGDLVLAKLFLDISKAVYEWDPESQTEDLWLEVSPENRDLFTDDATEKIKEICCEVSRRRGYGDVWVGVRETLPEVGPDWRELIKEQLGGSRPSNQARRIQSEPPRFADDGLLFTNGGERTVYRALKQIQEKDLPDEETIGIYPLPGGRVLGHTWEPDMLVTYKGRAGILEVDGPVHNGRRALDRTRDHVLMNAGIAFVDRVPVEALGNTTELTSTLRRFLRRLGDAVR